MIIKNGINKFLNLENNLGKSIHYENTIISTGGSMVYNKEAMEHFKYNLNCEIIHLHLTLNEFIKRVNNLEERGVINKYGLTIEELYSDRIRLCNKYSNQIINVDNIDISKLLKIEI